jgi:hypothetical protein
MTDKYTPGKGDYISLKGKQYLPARRRVQWLRSDHPDWGINTDIVRLDWDAGIAVVRAEVTDDTGRLIGAGTKTETRKGFPDFLEKAETGAIGRAVAVAGYGTEDALDLDEGEHVADSPIQQPERGRGARASSPNDSAPASYNSLRGALLEAAATHGWDRDRLTALADEIGVPKGGKATAEQLIDMIARIEQPGGSAPHPADDANQDGAGDARAPAPMATPEDGGARAAAPATSRADGVEGSSPAHDPQPGVAPTIEQVLAVSGGEEIPPKPHSAAYKALEAHEKAAARAYWADKGQEQGTLAEALGAPGSDR